jgi:cyanate lyase
MENQERLNLIKQICESKKKKTNVSFAEFARALGEKENQETIGLENAPYVDWKREDDPIDEEIKSQIFG